MPHTSNPRFDDDIHSTRCLILSLHICLFYHHNIFSHFCSKQCVVDPELFIPDPTTDQFRIRSLFSKTFQIKRLFAFLMFEG
jgi:hypothetical protein